MDKLVQTLESMHSFDNRVTTMLFLMLLYAVGSLTAVSSLWMGWLKDRLAPTRLRVGLSLLLILGCCLLLCLFAWVLPSILQWASALHAFLPLGLRLLIWLQSFHGLLALSFGGGLAGLLILSIPVKTSEGLKLLNEVLAGLNFLVLLLTVATLFGLSSLHWMMQQLLGQF